MPNEFGIFYGKELYDCGDNVPYIIENILDEQAFMCLHAEEGVGKSVLVQQLMHNMTVGKSFLDTFAIDKPYNVLWCQGEGSRKKMLKRIKDMKRACDLDDKRWAHINASDISLDYMRDIDRLLVMAEKPKIDYDVIVFDSLYGFVDGNMNDNKCAKDCTRHLRKIAGEYNAALIIINHKGKDQWSNIEGKAIKRSKKNVFGARQWGAFFTVVYELSCHKGTHYLEIGKDRDGENISKISMQMIVPQKDNASRLFFTQDTMDTSDCYHKIKRLLRDAGHLPIHAMVNTQHERDDKKVSEATFYRVIKDLVANKLVTKSKDKHGKTWYHWVK